MLNRKDVQVLMAAYTFLLVFYSWLLLSEPNSASRYYHVASEQFNGYNLTKDQSPVWYAYQKDGGQPSPAMSKGFRFKFWGLCMGDVVTCILWQKVSQLSWRHTSIPLQPPQYSRRLLPC